MSSQLLFAVKRVLPCYLLSYKIFSFIQATIQELHQSKSCHFLFMFRTTKRSHRYCLLFGKWIPKHFETAVTAFWATAMKRSHLLAVNWLKFLPLAAKAITLLRPSSRDAQNIKSRLKRSQGQVTIVVRTTDSSQMLKKQAPR